MPGLLSLDLATAFLFASVMQVGVALLMLFVYRAQNTYPGFGFWVASFVFAASGFALFAGRGQLDPLLGKFASNMLMLCVLPLQVEGFLRFVDAPNTLLIRRFNWAAMLGWMAVFSYLFFSQASQVERMLAISTGFGTAYVLVIAVQLRSPLARRLPATKILLGCAGVGLLVNASRVAAVLGGPGLADGITSNGGLALAALVSAVLTVIGAFGMVSANSQRVELELRAMQKKLKHLASIDPLTELRNRRSFLEEGARLVGLAARHHRPLSVLVADVDHFKRVNDTHGHLMGDRVLTMVANSIVAALRHTDLVGRLGGEEFGIVLMETDAAAAELGAERIRRAVAAIRPPWPGLAPITISLGVAALGPGTTGLDDLLQRADEALYAAKRAGRDRWVMAK